jgi:hypothetical protein
MLHLAIGLFSILYFDGTGDAGDSIYHYLYAKYAFTDPSLFFNHWAKPLYVLIFSPFAQFGFIGVKILNLIIVNLSLLFTYKLSRQWFNKQNYLALILLIFCPLYYVFTFSGLTEPLFALLLLIGTYLFTQKRIRTSLIIISFLPFVRSEGLLFLIFFGLWLVIDKKWKVIPYLISGTVIYSIVGYFIVYNDLLWVFSEIPYATTNSIYGSGELFHFFEQLLYVVGIPFYIFIWIGVILLTREFILKKESFESYYFLVLGAGMFILAHSTFWFLGIFNSMGLNRVLICVVPFLSIIAGQGVNTIYHWIKKKNVFVGRAFLTMSILAITLFPFSGNKAAVNFKEEMSLNTDQVLARNVGHFLEENEIDFNKLYAAHPYLFEVLNINCFDEEVFEFIGPQSGQKIKDNEIIVWENWFSIVEQNTPKAIFDNNDQLELIYEDSTINQKGRLVHYAVYKKHNT